MRLIDADKSDEIIIFDKENELLQCSVVRDYCERQREFLNKFPTIDAEPVRHGHWNSNNDCSLCGMPAPTDDRIDFINIVELNFCPYCGAKMDEVSDGLN